MSTVTTTIQPCPALQDMLNRWFQVCINKRQQTPLLNFLLSPENSSGIRQVVNPVGGKKREVTLIYDQVIPISEVSAVASCDRVCDATTERGDLANTYSIDCTDGYYVEGKITLSDWNESCRNNNEVIASRLQLMIDALVQKVADAVAGDMNALIGDWSTDVVGAGITVDADGFINVSTFASGSTTQIDPTAFQKVNMAKMMTGFCAPTFTVGGSDLYQYWQLMKAGCCTQDGIDAMEIMNQYGEVVAYDRWVAAAFGNDVSIMLQLGSAQLLTYNAVTSPLQLGSLVDLDMSYRNFWEGIIVDPISGLPIDISIKQDCGDVHIVLTSTVKPVALPNDLWPAGHHLEGVNYLTGIQVVNS